jgi:molecular chaperone GrpE
MDKDKQDKNKKRPEIENNREDENSADNGQTMVALTFDEYDALEKELESLQAQVEEQQDGWLRTRADFDNYKKRVQRDAARSYQDAMASIIKTYLAVADDLERALKNKPEGKQVAGWVDGIELIYQKLLTQMKNQGVEQIDVNPGDTFDPNFHEAITQEDHPTYSEGQIIDIIQPGYRITDRIIRPAMVRVAR